MWLFSIKNKIILYYTGRLETLNMGLLRTLRSPTLNKYICKPTKCPHIFWSKTHYITLLCFSSATETPSGWKRKSTVKHFLWKRKWCIHCLCFLLVLLYLCWTSGGIVLTADLSLKSSWAILDVPLHIDWLLSSEGAEQSRLLPWPEIHM